ncbi:MAG: hypothetical protein LC130_30285 [Bryobacterales bacterium]|nr:hypothetical protein [Bryobacterales bacterium]
MRLSNSVVSPILMWLRFVSLLVSATIATAAGIPPNQWVELVRDSSGGRRGSAVRYVPDAGAFFLWGFFDYDPEFLQEHPLMEVPEYDVVAFDPAIGRWQNQLPKSREREWSHKLPLAYVPRTYSAITSGSERTVLRGATNDAPGVPRPDLNIVFDQVAWHPRMKSLLYFTGGLTAAYDTAGRRWTDLRPLHSPPPVVGGSLAYDPVNGEMVLFGGGHVAERDQNGNLAGYTGTWVLRDRDWLMLPPGVQPPPRMNTRMAADTHNGVLVLFGGDGQSHFLADTWLYDMKTRSWRLSKATAGPEGRAGHFTVYDPGTGWVIIGGGYNQRDLTDMWAYDAAADRWWELDAKVPAGFYITADIASDKRLIVLLTNSRRPDDRMTCNVLYPVRTTYGFRIDSKALRTAARPATVRHEPVTKRVNANRASAKARLDSLPLNQWVLLNNTKESAPVRTWGSATFDTTRGEILYWGGGHCGYGGSDVDAYSLETNRWRFADDAPEFPERAWDLGVRSAGVTFRGSPWTEHGRRIYAYDPVSGNMIMAIGIRLTTGYDPEALRDCPARRTVAPDAIVQTPSSYTRNTTFSYDTQSGRWELAGPAPLGVDTLVSTPHGVMGVNVNWRSRLNDAGYQLPWRPQDPPVDHTVYLFNLAGKRWTRLGSGQPSPQNLYEMTSLAYDTKRNRLMLHGGGARRNELWAFDYRTRRWIHLKPEGDSPAASREAVYLPAADVLLISSPAPENRGVLALWAYSPDKNRWRRVAASFAGGAPRGAAGQNRAMVYDPKHDLILLVLGESLGKAAIYGMRYSP